MKDQLKNILAKMKEFNSGDMSEEVFGLSFETHYDVLVVAPGWKPTKILPEQDFSVTVRGEHSYTSGYEVECGNCKIAWIQTASGACNLIDHLAICAHLNFDKLVFLGAVGGLKPDFELGDVCVPSECIEGSMACAYLREDICSWQPFGKVSSPCPDFVSKVVALADFQIKTARVYCTDSISCEYYQLDFIRSFDADLIEMETAAFHHMAALLEKPAIALLAVSDNPASGEPLLGRSDEQQERYNIGRRVNIPSLLKKIAQMEIKE